MPPLPNRDHRHHRATAALTIVLIVVLSPSRMYREAIGYPASAIGALRGIVGAQQTFASSCGGGFYAPSLVALATTPSGGGGDGFIGSDLGSDPAASGEYWIRLVPGPRVAHAAPSCNGVGRGKVVSGYVVVAEPSSAGLPHFAADQTGVLYESDSAISLRNGLLPAGLTPIQ